MKTILEMLKSKKVIMTIVGVLTTYVILPFLNDRLQLGVDPEAINNALYGFIAYVLAQGGADLGKVKAATDQQTAILQQDTVAISKPRKARTPRVVLGPTGLDRPRDPMAGTGL